MVEINVADPFRGWYEDLTAEEQAAVARVVGLLEERGVGLGYPHSSEIKGSAIALRELRIQYAGRPYRVFYAFDPKAADSAPDRR